MLFIWKITGIKEAQLKIKFLSQMLPVKTKRSLVIFVPKYLTGKCQTIFYFYYLLNYFLFPSDTGNKAVMDGVQITGDILFGVNEEPLTVYAEDYTECMEECKSRYLCHSLISTKIFECFD